jgi:hypothetical protein
MTIFLVLRSKSESDYKNYDGTTGKRHSFVGTDKCIQIIFVGLGHASMNIWVVRFDFDQIHIFIDNMVYIHQLIDEYMGHRAAVTSLPIFVG